MELHSDLVGLVEAYRRAAPTSGEKAALANLIFAAVHELNRLGFTNRLPEPLPCGRRTTMEEHPEDFALQDTQPDLHPVEDEALPDDCDSQD